MVSELMVDNSDIMCIDIFFIIMGIASLSGFIILIVFAVKDGMEYN